LTFGVISCLMMGVAIWQGYRLARLSSHQPALDLEGKIIMISHFESRRES
jgi:hypothetical protein